MERENDYEQGQKPTTYRKLENFINCYPLTVKINDDMRRGRFIETDFKDHQDKVEQREFFEAEALRANNEYRNQIRVVNAATHRYDRKKQLLKPDDKTPPQDIDAKIRSVNLDTLEQKMDSERNRLAKIQTDKERAQKNLRKYMEDFFEEKERPTGSVYKNESGCYVTTWVNAPHYMHQFMPDREDPSHVYCVLRKQLMRKTKSVTLENSVELMRRFIEALEPMEYADWCAYVNEIITKIESRKDDVLFTRLHGIVHVSRILKPTHQHELHGLLYTLQHADELMAPFSEKMTKEATKIKNARFTGMEFRSLANLSKAQKNELNFISKNKPAFDAYLKRQANRGGGRDKGTKRKNDQRNDDFQPRDNRNENSNRGGGRGRGRGRGGGRGRGRGRGGGQSGDQQPQQQQNKPKDEVPKLEPPKVAEPRLTKQLIWKHCPDDRDTVIETLRKQS